MDLITTSLLTEFSNEFEVADCPEDDRFEMLSGYITIKRHYTETFSPADIDIGGDVQGIDAVATIVNGVLITEVDALEELVAAGDDYLEVVFVFVQAKLDESVHVPLRLVWTQDENVVEDIIRATNKQTEIKPDQFFAITEFGKQLEAYFQGMPEAQRLFYERRSRQYDRLPIEKTRIVVQTNAVRAFAAMFLHDPHSTIRRYKSLSDRVGNDIFVAGHKPDPYYTAAYANYGLEFLWRNYRHKV